MMAVFVEQQPYRVVRLKGARFAEFGQLRDDLRGGAFVNVQVAHYLFTEGILVVPPTGRRHRHGLEPPCPHRLGRAQAICSAGRLDVEYSDAGPRWTRPWIAWAAMAASENPHRINLSFPS